MEFVRESEYVWRMPRSGGMRVDGVVFASESLFVKAREDRALDQVAAVAHLPGIVGNSVAMPDIHWGYGFPIGGIAATDVEAGGVVSPGGVGFDIGCGVRLLRSDIAWEEGRESLPALVDALAGAIPRGVGGAGLRRVTGRDMTRVLEEGMSWAVAQGLGWEEDLESAEGRGAMPGASAEAVSERAKERGAGQLGSLGAGNHFLEVQVVDAVLEAGGAEAMGLAEGQLCLMIHSGSRGLGHQICTEEVRAFGQSMQRAGLSLPDRQLACAPVESPEGQRYTQAMAAAANYARVNRQLLSAAARDAFERVFRKGARSLGLQLVYDVSHNIAQVEDHEVEGRPRRLCVHRKGATRALGPGSEEVPARYRDTGQPVIVPGSMGSPSFVLTGSGESKISWCSTCHGAGRMMSRKEATRKMKGRDLSRKLEAEGILVRAQQERLLAEEAPYAYKDASEVVRVCEGAGLSRAVARLRPVGVIKG